ncbi:MAG TPA: 16S rRNA (guanine(527)-N(7))-methyltransferase RsmG [Firmicutes bacterium]|nr:16S rRNA (guanine(527)-N(7))-methyltransferase RsmG [Bacillota bacterium]
MSDSDANGAIVQRWSRNTLDALRAGGIRLSAETLSQLEQYANHVELRGKSLNLVSASDVTRILDRHVFDSLTALPLVVWEDCDVVDIGSGAGFPGIPLAITQPSARFLLVERTRKRVAFLMQATRELGLSNTIAVWADAETLALKRGAFADTVTIRAVTSTNEALALAAPLLKPTGVVILWQTADQYEREPTPTGWTAKWQAVLSLDSIERGIRVCHRTVSNSAE